MLKYATLTPPRSGMFSGADFRDAGGGRSALPGTSWLERDPTPPPTAPPVPAPKPTPQAQQPPAKPSGPFNVGTPQGFASLAGMFRPVTQAVLQSGGMPALMGIYGMVSGNTDWQNAMTKNPNYTGQSQLLTPSKPLRPAPATPAPTAPREVTASFRFPLPVCTANGRLTMPRFEKKADSDWGYTATPKELPTPAWGFGGSAPVDPGPAWGYLPGASGSAESTPATEPQPAIGPHLVQRLGTDIAAYEGINQTLKRTAPHILPRLGVQGAMRVPGIKGGLLWETPINAATDLLDAAGIHDIDGSKGGLGSFWRAPDKDTQGEIVRDALGNAKTHYGWNPGAFGWNMAEHAKGTTPDGTIALGLGTGNEKLDDVGSYATSALRAFTNPLKSSRSLGSFAWYDMNPIVQALTNADEREGWQRFMRKKPLSGQETSIPLSLLNHNLVSQPWRTGAAFRPGGQHFDREAMRYTTEDRYHPVYNPTGSVDQPWFGQRWWDKAWN
jgi:hypothetical protein